MKPEPLILPRNCGNCRHFDGDCHCALRYSKRFIAGGIVEPNRVVCAKHQEKEKSDEDNNRN